MKKLFYLLLFFTSISFSQTKLTEYKASNEINYKIGDTVRLGMGSGFQGTFVHLQVGGWMGPSSTQIGSAYNGLNVIIKKIKKATFKGAEKVGFIVGGGNITNYILVIEDAIATCEVVPCLDKNKPQQPVEDKFDKLAKLKKLLDSGVLTPEEYDKEKKKLLE